MDGQTNEPCGRQVVTAYDAAIINLYMNYYFKRPNQLKRYAAMVLVMFMVSVLNMSLQIPVHAAMQSMPHQGMDMSDGSAMVDHSVMQTMDMAECHCPPALCESVEAQQDQLTEISSPIIILDVLAFHPAFVGIQEDTLQQFSDISFQYHDWQYHQHTPPPLSLTTTLLI